jgi:hypothetical protein
MEQFIPALVASLPTEMESGMRLTFKPFDGRKFCYVDVVDQETGRVVGYINPQGVGFGGRGGIEVNLFDGKYRTFANRYEECIGFVNGVQSVLNHMVKLAKPAANSAAA